MMKPLNKAAKNHNLKQSSQLNNSPLKSMFKKNNMLNVCTCYMHKRRKGRAPSNKVSFPVRVL